MAISIFPSTAAEFVSNNFVVDMNDTSNNTADTGGVKQAGPYSMSFSSGGSSFDVYLIDEDGNSVGYSNSTSITASGLFSSVVILGVANDEIVTFNYSGSVNNADGEGDEPGAGAYLVSASPTDLPSIDDTTTVTGGNFADDVEITFENGATVLSAKNIVKNSTTELLVTRPDALIEDDAPYDLKAVNPGVTPPTGSDSHILVDAITAGSDPTWVTGSDLPSGTLNQTYVGATLEATDSDGTVVSYTITAGALPTGLSLVSSTGVISGTPTSAGSTFTVTAEDDGGNTTPKEFGIPVIAASGGSVTTSGGGVIHTFSTTDDFVADVPLTVSYVLVGGGAGGGAGGATIGGNNPAGGGGGGGGMISSFAEDEDAFSPVSITAGTHVVTIGAGGNSPNSGRGNMGGDTTFSTFGTAEGGSGGGGANGATPLSGGAGGGAQGRNSGTGPGGVGNQGGNGGAANFAKFFGAGGGGGGVNGANGGGISAVSNQGAPGGAGSTTNISGSPVTYAAGGAGGNTQQKGKGGSGGVAVNGNAGGAGIAILRY